MAKGLELFWMMAVLGLAGRELNFLPAAHTVPCATFVPKMVLRKCQRFCCGWAVLSHHQVIVSGQKTERMSKSLGGDTAGTAGFNWPGIAHIIQHHAQQ